MTSITVTAVGDDTDSSGRARHVACGIELAAALGVHGGVTVTCGEDDREEVEAYLRTRVDYGLSKTRLAGVLLAGDETQVWETQHWLHIVNGDGQDVTEEQRDMCEGAVVVLCCAAGGIELALASETANHLADVAEDCGVLLCGADDDSLVEATWVWGRLRTDSDTWQDAHRWRDVCGDSGAQAVVDTILASGEDTVGHW
jgi:hypothetical protein